MWVRLWIGGPFSERAAPATALDSPISSPDDTRRPFGWALELCQRVGTHTAAPDDSLLISALAVL